MNSNACSQTRAKAPSKLTLVVITGDHVPSFKNTKRSILDSTTGKQRTLTPGNIKKRMDLLEMAIVSVLYSKCQTSGAATDLECRKQLRTLWSGLCDYSLKEIPEFSFGVEHVEKHQEGVTIEIEKL